MTESDAQEAEVKANEGSISESEPAKAQRRPEPRTFPRRTLREALKVAQAIKANNAGRPWQADLVAKAIDIASRSSNFQVLVAASREYDLTTGNNRSDISLTELGRRIVYAESDKIEKEHKTESFFKVDIFHKIYEYYNGSNLPENRFVTNVLIDKFNINEAYHEELLSIFRENCSYIGIDTTEVSKKIEIVHPASDRARSTSREAEATSELIAFVVMPFVERGDRRAIGFFAEVLESLITPAAIEAGFSVKTANREGSDLIQSTIINELLDADLVVADLTDHNPNVMFELGLRVGDNKKPTAIIKSNDTGRLFDVDNMMRVYEYNPNLWASTISKDVPELARHIRATWDNRSKSRSYIKILRHETAG